MAPNDDRVVRVTLEELEKVSLPAESAASATVIPAAATGEAAGRRSYGNINTAEPAAPDIKEERGSVLLQGWFYLGAAGLIGAAAGWSICEPAFIDGGYGNSWGNFLMMPLVTCLMLTGFAVAESIVERSLRKAGLRALLAIPLGIISGFVFEVVANIVYGIGMQFIYQLGVRTNHSPAFWVIRGIGWVVFGVAGGLIYGLIGQSGKKAKYGVLGGMIGAGLGGLLFDPIALMLDNAVVSRFVGFGLFGLATGAAIGFVESALKDRWLYVSSGPLAGKQFILYKPQTSIGSQQQCDIYLFKDTSIQPQHAVLEARGNQMLLRAATPVYVSGMPTQSRVLLSGDVIQIGRYTFRYNERLRQ